MKEHIIYRTSSLYRGEFRVRAFSFGEGEKSLCIVGNTRGHEYQQLYICGLLVRRLKELEEEGRLVPGKEIMVIPSVNPSSMNIGKRFWAIDNTDINRMFPGYDLGETTQRIAAGVFEVVNKFKNGIQFPSYYMPGGFCPHVRITRTGFENVRKAEDFGLPHIVLRDPRPYDTTTLNYNWQIWETDAYSLYSSTTKTLDPQSAGLVLSAVERFMIKNGMLTGELTEHTQARVFNDDELLNVRTECAGLFRSFVGLGDEVEAGDICAEVCDPYTGEVIETLRAPARGTVFFMQDEPLVYAKTAVIKILPI